MSQDGRTLAHFGVSLTGADLHVRNLEDGTNQTIAGNPRINRGYPAISPSGQLLAYSAVVPGPPLQRPLFLTNITAGDVRLVYAD